MKPVVLLISVSFLVTAGVIPVDARGGGPAPWDASPYAGLTTPTIGQPEPIEDNSIFRSQGDDEVVSPSWQSDVPPNRVTKPKCRHQHRRCGTAG